MDAQRREKRLRDHEDVVSRLDRKIAQWGSGHPLHASWVDKRADSLRCMRLLELTGEMERIKKGGDVELSPPAARRR